MRRCAMAAAAMLLVSACGEKVQTVPLGGARKVDGMPWAASSSPYLASGWTTGNEASWDTQLQRRTQAQNDYSPRQ